MSAARILIIEDDITLSDQIAHLLEDSGFTISQCQDGQKGLFAALQQRFDLILLDILLPSLDGLSVLNQLRKIKQTPVMMITASGAEQERIEGYRTGADDYLPKPFNFTEMLLRIEALLRRSSDEVAPLSQHSKIQIGDMQLNRVNQEVKIGQTTLELTPIQFKLIWTLVENSGEVLSKAFLYQCVLDRPFSRYDRSLDMHLSRVRKKLIEAGMPCDCLSTIHGKGYRFS
jgi:two-component system response regulator PfeR